MGTAKQKAKRPEVAPDDAIEVDLLAALCELTVVVAQAGQRLSPPLDIPSALKPFLKFTRILPPQGVRVVRKILDTDEGWRTRVAAAATPALVGEAGMLFLTRQDGWEVLYANLVAKKRTEATTEGSQRTIRDLERRLAAAQDRIDSLTKELISTRSDGESRIAQQRTDALANANSLRKERDRITALLADVASAQAAAKHADSERVKATKELDQTKANLSLASSEIAALTQRVSELAQRRASRPAVNLDELSLLLDAARQEVDRVRSSAVAAVSPTGATVPAKTNRPTKSKVQRLADQTDESPQLQSPMALPPGVLAGSLEAAVAAVQIPNVMVIIDGYNLGKTIWPHTLDLVVLRDQLLARLEGFSSRSQVPVTVVFDGANPASSVARRGRGSSVHVVFTSAKKEADDLITELVSSLRPQRPVVVVSSDLRVQRLTESLGANVVSSDIFLRSSL